VHIPHQRETIDPVSAFTVGGVRDFLRAGGFDFGAGADVVFYQVPPLLVRTHGSPVSYHVFFRLRPPESSMGRMWNMTMTQPMRGHSM